MPRRVRGYQPPRAAAARFALARITTYYSYALVEGREALVMFFYVLNYSARGGNYDQGCQNAYNSGLPSVAFFLAIYVIVGAIPTCMQNFIKIDRKNNHTFFIQSYWTMFLLQTVLSTLHA